MKDFSCTDKRYGVNICKSKTIFLKLPKLNMFNMLNIKTTILIMSKIFEQPLQTDRQTDRQNRLFKAQDLSFE